MNSLAYTYTNMKPLIPCFLSSLFFFRAKRTLFRGVVVASSVQYLSPSLVTHPFPVPACLASFAASHQKKNILQMPPLFLPFLMTVVQCTTRLVATPLRSFHSPSRPSLAQSPKLFLDNDDPPDRQIVSDPDSTALTATTLSRLPFPPLCRFQTYIL